MRSLLKLSTIPLRLSVTRSKLFIINTYGIDKFYPIVFGNDSELSLLNQIRDVWIYCAIHIYLGNEKENENQKGLILELIAKDKFSKSYDNNYFEQAQSTLITSLRGP